MAWTKMTRKGQVTIPAEIRRVLRLRVGDRLSVEQHGEAVLLRRVGSVAERTAGALAAYRLGRPLSATEERAAFEATVAAEVAADDLA